ncbi:toll/interleukin-1 receptor domain-containing protein [Mucilaginibacter sp. AW1-3]
MSADWENLIKLIYKHRDEIKKDNILTYATGVFETEFLRTVSDLPITNIAICDQLENLFMLHRGDFYKLKSENYKILLSEMANRNVGNDGPSYSRELKLLEKEESVKDSQSTSPAPIPANGKQQRKFYNGREWFEIYNRLFDIINVKGDPATYFSGPRFIGVVQEFKPFFPDYSQYCDLRKQEGLSLLRKEYYYDILKELDPNIRDAVITRILGMVRPFAQADIAELDELLGIDPIIGITDSSDTKRPVVFISYTWDSEVHKEWVLNLANRLIKDGIVVLLDVFELKPGRNMPHFMERAIAKADKVLVIFTPGYKEKADNRKGGAGYEYSIMNTELYQNQTNNEKIIPILRDGDQFNSIPTFMRQFIHLNMCESQDFLSRYAELKAVICDQPTVSKPELGPNPIVL